MAKETVTTRLDPDTKAELNEYADERDVGQTEAARRLIRTGLATAGHPVATADGGNGGGDDPRTLLERLASKTTVFLSGFLVIFAGAAFLLASTGTFDLVLTALGLVLSLLAIVTMWTATLAQVALARPLRGLLRRAPEVER